ncbi:hypothetical protein AGMMS49975_11280 [Clostridia bacterium]|nr:hypothetical protein AGMMS49975_11280 [Clostridia bacterium]
MLGAIIGDIVGSRFEWNNIKTKEFDFLTYRCELTDDSVMSLAVAKALLDCDGDYDKLGDFAAMNMREIGMSYENVYGHYGWMFRKWLSDVSRGPYNSFGNGAAMRVSACGFAANTLDDVILLSRKVTEVSHDHPEGLKGAEATAVCVFLARTGSSILEIRNYVDKHYYLMNFTLDSIRDSYTFDETCQGTVPQAIMAFLESTTFEDAIRNAISIGGDSDTLAAITGGIAEVCYGVPVEIREHALTFLDERLLNILNAFESKYPLTLEKSLNGQTGGRLGEESIKNVAYSDEYLEYRKEYEKCLYVADFFRGEETIKVSGKYSLRMKQYASDNAIPKYQGYLRGNEIQLIDEYGKSRYSYRSSETVCAVFTHQNGAEYFVFKQELYGYSVLDLETMREFHYIPKESFPFKSETFILCNFHYNKANNIMASEGCYWACPYSVALIDFSSPMTFSTQIDVNDFINPNYENEKYEDIDFVKWEGTDLVLEAEVFGHNEKRIIPSEEYMKWFEKGV